MYRMLCKALTTAALALVLWMAAPAPTSATDYGPILYGGDILYCGDTANAPNGAWEFTFACHGGGPSGNSHQHALYPTYCPDSYLGWCWQTDGYPSDFAQMQHDGNYVEYDGTTAKWATNTSGYYGGFLNVQNDSNIVVYTAWSSPVWSIW